MVFLEDPLWYSPLNVIHHFRKLDARLTPEEKNSKEFRKAKEVYAAALMVVGVRKSLDREFWLQAVGDEAQSPDVRTGTFVPPTKTEADDFSIQDVEVVQYDANSSEPLVEFLKRTKLAKTKAYDPLTTILCHIDQEIVLPPYDQLQTELAGGGYASPVMILGKTSSTEEKYAIAQINPNLDLITEFDLEGELKNRKYNGVLSLARGMKSKMDYKPEVKHFPFEKLGYTE